MMNSYHSIIIGKGKPLIFLPAAGFTGMEGLNLADALSKRYECHLLDLPGMGRSSEISGKVTSNKIALWLKEYIDLKKLTKVTLIGHSMGGAIAMCFTREFPGYVNSIVLLDQGHKPIPRFPTKEFGLFGYAMPLISGMERVFGDSFIKKIEKYFITSSVEPSSKENEKKKVEEFCEKFGVEPSDYIEKALTESISVTRGGLRLMFGYYRLNLPKILMQITLPTLLICASFKGIDEKEASITKKALCKLSNENLTLYEVNSHHYVHWADETCITKIEEFL